MNLHSSDESASETRNQLAALLNRALADEIALSGVTRDYHWNVTGPNFRSLHEVFDEQYHQIDDWIERIGERARALGLYPKADWRELVRARRFRPAAGAGLPAGRMVSSLSALHETTAQRLRADQEACRDALVDPATARLFDELVEYHETTAWLLGELREERELARA